jgi:PAS domain S-box-containing protein
MSWVTIIWSMVASACLTLAAMHLLVWFRKRTKWANLLFSLTASATAVFAGCEIWMMRAETPGQFGTALRWIHVPTWVIVVALVGFVRLHLRAGRPWLAWTVCVLRTFSLLLNFLVGQNLNFREVTRLRHIPFFGDSVSVAEGVSNPWMLVGQLSLLLFVVFVADAAITVWRRGDRQQALITGGSIVLCMLAGTVQAVLVLWGIVHWPITASLFFMPVVAAMGYEMSRDVLHAAQLSDDLRESEERMTLAAEAAGFGVWMWSIPRNQVWGSERWLRLFEFAPDATVTFEKVIQRIHPDDRESVESAVRRALADRKDYAGEYRVILPDGTQRWIGARGRMYPDTHGKPARMLGAAIDITERKRTEEALQNSEEKFWQFFKNTPDYCYIISTEGNILHINEAALKTLGYEREELVGKPLARIYAPESLARMEDLFNQWKESGQIRDEEMVIVTRNGERRVVILNVGVVKDKDGTILHLTSVQTDITERKQSEAALKESVERFRQVAETAGEFIWEVNAEGLYTYVSPTVEKILGYTPEELVGKKHFFDLFAPSVREELMATASQVNADRQSFRDFPNPNVSKSGKIVYLETSGAPVLDPAGNLVGYRGAAADVTGRKQAELEIGQQRNELAHLSRVSTMGVLTSSLAHELNQPLSAILSNAQAGSRFLAAATPDLAEIRGALEDIAQDAKRAGEVIRQMRALVRKDDPHLEPLDLNRVIPDVVRLLHSDMLVRKVRIALELDPELRPVNGDNAQLQQVMLNLVLNAFDAMKDSLKDKRTVIVRTRQLDAASIQVEVCDGGTGISPDRLVNLFEPFRSSKREGLGLGLSISHSIVEAHKGRLWAENNPDCGATFYFTLPIHEAELKLT